MAFLSALSAIGPAISGIATIAGGVISAAGQMQAARAQQQSLNYQAKQLEIKGKEEQAAAYFEADQSRKEKELALSSLQAKAAGSGFDATDSTTLQIGSDIERYGTLQQMVASYGGASRRAGLDAEAAGRRMEGAAGVQGAGYGAMGTIIGSFGQGFSRFNDAGLFNRNTTSSYRYA